MATDRVKECWEDFQAKVIPAGAGPVQRIEMRRAFYAGAWSMFNEMLSVDVDEEAGAEFLCELEAECEAFKAAVTRGDA